MNHRLQLLGRPIEFYMSANTLQAFDAVAQNIPTVVGRGDASRRTRRCSWRIPDQGIEKFEDLKKLTLFVSKEGLVSYFQWMKREFGFREQQVKPYTFNPQPFLADKKQRDAGLCDVGAVRDRARRASSSRRSSCSPTRASAAIRR